MDASGAGASGAGVGGDGDGAGKAALEAPAEATTPPPAPVAAPVPVPASATAAGAGTSGSGEKPVKRMMKTPYQLEVLEKTYAVEQYPSEAMRLELSAKIGLSDRQLQMWFCHRRLKDRKPPSKRHRREEESALAPVMPPPPVLPAPVSVMPLASSDLMVGAPGLYDEPLHPVHSRRGAGRSSAVPRISMPDIGKRYYEPPPIMITPAIPLMQLTQSELRVINSVESQLGEPLREDGPALGVEFDPLPPGAFGAPIVPEQKKQPVRSYDTKIFSRHDQKLLKASAFLPTMESPFVPNSFTGKRKSTVGNSPIVQPHVGSRAVHEYQFLPDQPSDTYERASRSHYYDTPVEVSNSRISSLTSGSQLLHGSEAAAPSYAFQGHTSGSSLLPQSSRSQVFPAAPADYETTQSNSNLNSVPVEGQIDISQVAAFENPLVSSERRAYHDEDSQDTSRVERKRKHNEEAKIAKEVEAHERRIRKELEKQDILNRKREEQRRKEMERLDRERRKEEERLLRERQREEERFQREQRREHERMEKLLQKQSRRAEKQRQKEELRKEKEAARQKAANERATARRIAREYMELVEDERLELMELAAQNKGLPSMLYLDSDTLQQLDSFRGMLNQFPPTTVRLKLPFSIKPLTRSEDNVGKLLMVWKFFITFTDVLGLCPVTLDEFVQSLHDYDSRLLGELHVALLKSIIKDIEDVARNPSIALVVNPGGHPQIVEGAYAWGFNIRSWQRHLNLLTWPEILRQFALSAGFGPQLKKRMVEDSYYRNDNEGHDGENVISTLRNGSAAVNAAAKMKERGYTNRRRSRHRLTPGTVKFAAFHVLSLEGSKGLTILEVAEKIQKSGLRDLTTSKTPEASIAAALSRDAKLFERTAPSTYCVKSPYRKDPADSEVVLSAAREKIRAFQNVLSDSEAEKEADEAERDDDSECDDADDDPDGDDVNTEVEDDKDPPLAVKAQDEVPSTTTVIGIRSELDSVGNALNSSSSFTKSAKGKFNAADTSNDSPLGGSSANHEVAPGDSENTQIDESNQVEPWVRALAEGDYCDLSVEERLNALVALVGVATEGNSIRGVLEERLELANALKKQMWAEAQLDKRRSKEEFASRVQYNSDMGLKADIYQENNATEITSTPACDAYKENDGHVGTINSCEMLDQHNQGNSGSMAYERNGIGQEILATPDTSYVQQYAYADKTRSQLKSYIGHRAEQLYVYRSLPLGQDRRRNRYWQFTTSASPNDPGSGRIFFESKDGCWRVIDSEEAFDSLVAALDTRGSREAQLHSMLQVIEPTFKEAIKRRSASIELSAGRYPKNGATDMIRANYHSEVGSSSSTPFGATSDSVTTYSDSFKVELGRNDFEKTAISKRADKFLKWMWRECYNQELTCAMKYGKKRCSELLHSCNCCYQIYLAEERHCLSCHKTFKSIYNFSDHTTQCEEKRRTDPYWKMQIADYSVPIGMVLLKLQLVTIEASIPSEALQPFWTDVYRKSWSVKLYTTKSIAETFQLLTVLEGAIRPGCLSSDFETTSECLNSQGIAPQNPVLPAGSASVLPWVPDTTSAVMLRMLDLDSAISYVQNQKMERDDGGFMKFPSRYTVAKSKQEGILEPTGSNLYDGRWLPGSGRRGRGRGSRGGSRGGRGRSRGGRIPRGVSGSSRIEFKDDIVASDKAPRKNARRGRARGRGSSRGSRRGRRTVRPRQPSAGRARSIPKENLLGSFSMLSSSKPAPVESPQSSGADEWGLETRVTYNKCDENSSGSQSEDNEENGQPMDEDYEEQVPVYSMGYSSGSRHHGTMFMMDHETDEEDEDAEGDENVEEDDADQAVDDADVEMDEDDEIGDDGEDGDVGGEMNDADEDPDATSYSSDYSE